MLSYEECKAIAEEMVKGHNATLDKAYKLDDDYVFDNSEVTFEGLYPIVVCAEDGKCWGLWRYIKTFKKNTVKMIEIEF